MSIVYGTIETPASKFIEEHGVYLEKWIEGTVMKRQYRVVEYGVSRASSQYGIPYETVQQLFDIRGGIAEVRQQIDTFLTDWCHKHPGHTLVYRRAPQVSNEPIDFDTDMAEPTRIKVRLRTHVLSDDTSTTRKMIDEVAFFGVRMTRNGAIKEANRLAGDRVRIVTLHQAWGEGTPEPVGYMVMPVAEGGVCPCCGAIVDVKEKS